MPLRPPQLVAALIVLVVAFGTAFALGRASAGDEPTQAASSSAQRLPVPSATGLKVKLQPAGSLPRLRPSETSTAVGSSPSGSTDSGSTTIEAAPEPSAPAPTPVTPSAPSPPSTSQPETPISGGDE